MGERFTLPVLPLRDTVVYPGIAVPISAGRPGTVAAVRAAMDGDRRLFALAQKENSDVPDPENLFRVGTVVRIIQTHRVRGGIQLLVQGEERAQAVAIEEKEDGILHATLLPLVRQPPQDLEDAAFQALDRELRERAAELGTRRGVPAEALNQLIHGVEESGSFADLVAFYLELPTGDKQRLLESLDDEDRMRRVLVAVERELARIDAQEDIQARVQEELGERQREMLLREQMKQIQRELGGEDERSDVDELRKRVEALELPESAAGEVDRELRRLERTSPQSAEYQVIRTFLEWITELPWTQRTEDKIDLAEAEEVLQEDHYGLEDVKDRVLEFLAVRKLQMSRAEELEAGPEGKPGAGPEDSDPVDSDAEARDASDFSAADADQPEPSSEDPDGEYLNGERRGEEDDSSPGGTASGHEAADPTSDAAEESPSPPQATRSLGRGPILLFTGPPGVGKTSIAQSIARALGRKYVRISLGGARDEADIRGHRRTYVGAMPGRIVQGMRQAKSKNPVFLLDEVDKLGTSFQGDPSSALLEVLDPAQNSSFTDHYLGIPYDLSEVLFIATANYAERIPPPLLDRMEKVEFGGYTEREKTEIALRYLLPRQRKEAGLTESEFEVDDEALLELIQKYTREAGVRQLERELGKLARKVAREIASGDDGEGPLTQARIRDLLGRPRVHPEQMGREDTVGVATGMFYTPTGGDIMFVEASIMPGDGGLVLTGQLGDVMKESGRAAWTYAKSHHTTLGIPEDRLKGREVHLHVPAGAVSKDGPSAGITMATALISALSDRKVRRDLAMTGELTLTGRVLPIGGLKEKVLGGIRAGIRTFVIPEDNEADLDDIPDEIRSEARIHMVSHLDQVLELAFGPGDEKEGAKAPKRRSRKRDEPAGATT